MHAKCPHCQRVVNFSSLTPGARVKCPFCGKGVKVPTPAPVVEAPSINTYESPKTAPQRKRRNDTLWLVTGVAGGILAAFALMIGGCVVLTGGAVAVQQATKPEEPSEADLTTTLVAMNSVIEIKNARLRHQGLSPTLLMDIRNNRKGAISKLDAHVRVYTQGRSVPWREDMIVLPIPGGIEPGEQKSFAFDSPFEWRYIPDRQDVEVQVIIIEIYDAYGDPVVGAF